MILFHSFSHYMKTKRKFKLFPSVFLNISKQQRIVGFVCTQNFVNVADDSKELPVQDTLGVSLIASDLVAGFETCMSFHQLK